MGDPLFHNSNYLLMLIGNLDVLSSGILLLSHYWTVIPTFDFVSAETALMLQLLR